MQSLIQQTNMKTDKLSSFLLIGVVCLGIGGLEKLQAQGAAVQGVIQNQTSQPVSIYWADEKGNNQNYFDTAIPAGGKVDFQSYPGTVWRAYQGNTFISDYTATTQAGQIFQVTQKGAPAPKSGKPAVKLEEWRKEQTLLSTSIGKWQRLVFRKGVQMRPADDYVMSESSASYYTLSVDEYERDREGQGVFRIATKTLLYCDSNDVKMNETDDAVNVVMQFNGSQGGGQSTVRLDGRILKDDEGEYVTVKFSGDGSVHRYFVDRLKDSVDGAEWFESLDTLRWKSFASDTMSASE